MLKTVEEWFDELPEPYRTEAKKNVKRRYGETHVIKRKSSLHSSLFVLDWNRPINGAPIKWLDVVTAVYAGRPLPFTSPHKIIKTSFLQGIKLNA